MSNAYDQSRNVEKEGIKLVKPLLDERLDDWHSTTDAPRHYQIEWGDFFGRSKKNGEFLFVELKVEKEWTGNLFIETWSNARYPRENRGWIRTSRVNLLLYTFLDKQVTYIIPMGKIQEWAEKNLGDDKQNFKETSPRLEQRNQTIGYLVPISHLKEIGIIRDEWTPPALEPILPVPAPILVESKELVPF